MLIYDYKNQEVSDFNTFFITLSFLVIGLVFLFIFSKYKPDIKHDFSTRLLGLSREDLINQAKMTPVIFRMIGITLLIMSFVSLFMIIRDIIYIHEIEYFEDVELLSGQIEKVETRNIFGTEQITIKICNKSFHIIKDQRYIPQLNLSIGDSIKIEYFVNNVNSKYGESKCFEVIRIELK